MTYSYPSHLKLGILGGGQLGRMLIAPALRLGINLRFLDHEGAPCQDSSPFFHTGSFLEREDVLDFAKGLDAIGIEIENVNTSALFLLEEQGFRVRPSAKIIELVQDKSRQKEFYEKHSFPTAKCIARIENRKEIQSHIKSLPLVQKICRSGYDGYGVKILENERDSLEAFDAPSILEEKISLAKELAVLLARDSKGRLAVYPPVEMKFHPTQNILEHLFCPANIAPQIRKRACELSMDLAEKLGLIGLLAVELFLTDKGEILINEMAPRPHNSGHHSIELCPVSQFEQYLRAIFDLPLGDTTCRGYGATLNLLCQGGEASPSESPTGSAKTAKFVYQGLVEVLEMPGVFVHLYGKKEFRPFRKMGHITILGENPSAVQKKVQQVQKQIRVQTL